MLGEFELIESYFTKSQLGAGIDLGIGDDCALVTTADQSIAITTDTLNEGIHFFKGCDPYALGYRSLQVNLSDLAAMGARPWCFTLSLSLPQAQDEFLKPFSQGLFYLAEQAQIKLIGGNTAKGPLSITISCYGRVDKAKALRRSNACVGDEIYVTGQLGFNALMVAIGYGSFPQLKESFTKFQYEAMTGPLRCAFAHELTNYSRCAIDISDGVIGDLKHILKASHCGACVDLDQLPMDTHLQLIADPKLRMDLALQGGDYELLFTLAPQYRSHLYELAQKHQVKVTRIGSIISDALKVQKDGRMAQQNLNGFEHF